jgi:hypothetical protein
MDQKKCCNWHFLLGQVRVTKGAMREGWRLDWLRLNPNPKIALALACGLVSTGCQALKAVGSVMALGAMLFAVVSLVLLLLAMRKSRPKLKPILAVVASLVLFVVGVKVNEAGLTPEERAETERAFQERRAANAAADAAAKLAKEKASAEADERARAKQATEEASQRLTTFCNTLVSMRQRVARANGRRLNNLATIDKLCNRNFATKQADQPVQFNIMATCMAELKEKYLRFDSSPAMAVRAEREWQTTCMGRTAN